MIRTIIFIVLMIIAIKGALESAFGALLGYIWFALFRPQEWLWIDITELRLSLVIGCVLVIRCISSKSWPNFSHPISKGIILFLLSGLIAQINAVNQDVGLYWLDFFARLTLVSLLVITLVNTERRFFYSVLVICSSLGYYTAKAGLASMLAGGVKFHDGLAGAFVDNNGYALAAVMIIPLLIVTAANVPAEWTSTNRKLMTWGYRIAAPLTAYAVISTFSRGGLLALGALIVAHAILHGQKVKLLLISLIFVVLIPFVPLPAGYVERVSTITSYEEQEETSAMSRLHFWNVAVRMAVDNPFGVGMFNFSDRYNQYDSSDGKYGKNRVAHNSHLQVLAENGFVGFIAWIFLFIYSFRTCYRIRKLAVEKLDNPQDVIFYTSMPIALIISMVSFVVGGTFSSMALNDLSWLTFALVAALDRLFKERMQHNPAVVVISES